MPATDERTLADLRAHVGALAASLVEAHERIVELETHMSAQIAATAEFELYRRATRELIARVDRLEDQEI